MLVRPKNISNEQWSKALELYNSAKSKGDRYPELTVAQAALETGWFKSPSGKYNYFGQKATEAQAGTLKSTQEVAGNKTYRTKARFRDYSNIDEAVNDRLKKWSSKYKNADTIDEAISSIWQYDPKTGRGKGYATDSNYGTKLKSILNSMGVNSQYESEYAGIPQQTQQEAPTYTPFERYLTENQGLIETAQAYKEKEEVAQAKRELAQEEGFTRALQTYTQPQQQVQNQPQYQQTQSYLESPELFQLAQVAMPEFQQGGIIKDNNGYWNPNNWGKTVEISSPNITMNGVHQPLYGYAPETGERKLMLPGQYYYFEGATKVIETPLK